MRLSGGAIALVASTYLVGTTVAVKHHDFKTCPKSGFCRRGRALAERANAANEKQSKSWVSPYSVDSAAISFSSSKSSFTAPIKSSLYPDVNFELEVRVHEDGVVRVRVDEVGGLKKRYDEAASWALIKEPVLASAGLVKWSQSKKDLKAVYKGVEFRVTYNPLKVALLRDGREEIVLNGHGLFHMEHFRQKNTPVEESKPESSAEEGSPNVEEGDQNSEQVVMEAPKEELPVIKPTAWFEGDVEDDYWEETFLQWTDTKPKGSYYLFLLLIF